MQIPELDHAARRRWSRALDDLMQAAGLSKALAVASAGDFDLTGFEDAFSRLKNGDAAELGRWFDHRDGERARQLAAALGVDHEALVDALRAAATPGEAPWHPAFPTVEPDDVRVDPPLPADLGDQREGEDDDARLTRWLQGATGPIWVIGPPGSGRRAVAARLAMLGGGPIVDQTPPVGWASWAAQVEPGTIAIVSAAPTGRYGDRRLTVQPWDAALLATLADRLVAAGAVDSTHAERVRALVAAWRAAPDLIEPSFARPADLIGLLGALADSTLALEPGPIRQRLSAAAWDAICRRAPTLHGWGPGLLMGFWRRCWITPTLGVWRALTVAEAEAVVAETVAELRGHDSLGAVLDALEKKATRARLASLRRALDGVGPRAVLSALVKAGVLRESPGGRLVAADPARAVHWAAAALAERAPFTLDLPWRRLADAHWPALCDALARDGVSVSALEARLRDVPPRWRLDADRGLLHALASTPRDAAPTDAALRGWLPGAWADVVWAQGEGVFSDTRAELGREGTPAHATSRRLRAISTRWVDVLPLLDGPAWSDELVTHHVSPGVAARVRAWRYDGRPSMMSIEPLRPLPIERPPEWALPGIETLSAERYLDFVIAWLAPAQCLPLTPAHLPAHHTAKSWLQGLPEAVWARCEALAERGDLRAIALLSGRAYAPSDARRSPLEVDWALLWASIPLAVRRRWVTAGRDAPGFVRRWLALIDDAPETLLEMARGLDDDEAHALMHRALWPGFGPLGDDLWSRWDSPSHWEPSGPPGPVLAPSVEAIIELARRRRDVAILDEICALPRRWLDVARVQSIGGRWVLVLAVRRVVWRGVRDEPTALDAAFGPVVHDEGAIWRGHDTLVEWADRAAEVLRALGRPAVTRAVWSSPVDDWPEALRRGLADGASWCRLGRVTHRDLAAHIDALPPEVEAVFEALWGLTDHRPASLAVEVPTPPLPLRLLRQVAEERGLIAAAQTWLRDEPYGLPLSSEHFAQLANAPESVDAGTRRWVHAALLLEVCVWCGSRAVLALLTSGAADHAELFRATRRWLAQLAAAVDPDRAWQADRPRHDLLEHSRRRRVRAGRALLALGDDTPLAALLDPGVSPAVFGGLWPAVADDPARLSRLWQRVDDPVEWSDGQLFAAALACALPAAIEALGALPRSRRRVEVYRHRAQPWTAPLIEALADEAWAAGKHRETAAWALVLHHAHAPWNQPLERAVHHWLCDDADPFDRSTFHDDGEVFVGGARVLAALADTWRVDGSRPRWWPSGVRRLFDRVGPAPRWALSAFDLDWRSSHIHLGAEVNVPGGETLPDALLWRWLRELDATDLRDDCLDVTDGEWLMAPSEAKAWWLDTASRDALWAAAEQVDRTPGYRSGTRAGEAVAQLVERGDPEIATWLVELCHSLHPWDGDPLANWFGTHGHMSPDGRCMYLLRVAPERIVDVHFAWLAATDDHDIRVGILRHLALFVGLLDEHGVDAAAELRALIDRVDDTRSPQ